MKQNLLITGYDYELSRQIANRLAEVFSLRVFDQLELFEFDHLPRTLSDVLEEKGREYVDKKFNSILKMELDFDDAVFVCSLSVADNIDELSYKVGLSNFVILLFKDSDEAVNDLINKKYKSSHEKDFFCCSKEQLLMREHKILSGCADASVDIGNKTIDEICDEIIDKIKHYYSVG